MNRLDRIEDKCDALKEQLDKLTKDTKSVCQI
jgi:hypothetical protein